MHYFIKYLEHLLTATNQHGVHSPFVYDYLTKCLYKRPKYKTPKLEHVLLKSIPYFSVERLKIISKDAQMEKRIQKEFGLNTSEEFPFDMIYLASPDTNSLEELKDKVHNDTILLLGNIHNTKSSSGLWEAFKKDEIVTVSLDMFYCGVIFFRKEQAKQHFKIRI